MEYDYPLLQKITNEFEKLPKKDIENVYIFACQHILEPQGEMFKLISEFGINKKNIYILGKIYSTSLEVLEELKSGGFQAEQPDFDSDVIFDIQHIDNCKKLFNSFINNVSKNSKVIVIDDGAELITIFNDNFSEIDKSIKINAIEQTSSGFRKLEGKVLNFPVINVARSAVKLNKESPLIARLGCDRINEVINNYKITEPRILIIGLGPIGNNTMMILKEENYFVMGHDTAFNSPTEIVDLVSDNKINIIVGATGTSILNENQTDRLRGIKSDVHLISMSSSDREFSASYLRKDGKSDGSIHSDIKSGNIILINNGFPITFKGKRYESTPIEIEKTIALLYGSVLYGIVQDLNVPELTDVPRMITDIINDNE